MHPTHLHEWRDQFILTREIETPGERSEFFAKAKLGHYVQLFRGIHILATVWAGADVDERHIIMVKAAAAYATNTPVFSHSSAAALWKLPWIGAWPIRAHITVPIACGGRSKQMFARHTTGIPARTTEIDGVTVTTLARTVSDIARTQSFACAVTVADAALRRRAHPTHGVPNEIIAQEMLLHELDAVSLRQGVVKATRAIVFANAAAESPGESMSRVSMHRARIPAPELQVRLVGASGTVWTVDFYWPGSLLIGEFDGEVKYTKPEFLHGRSPAQAVIDEKYREDDLRAAGYRVTRWPWKLALAPPLLREKLVAGGLRVTDRSR